MVIRIGWKTAIFALLLIAGVSLGVWWAIGNAEQANVEDHADKVRIAELEDEIEELQHGAGEHKADADEALDRRIVMSPELNRHREAARHRRSNPGLIPLQEEIDTLKDYNRTLELSLRLANEETVDLRKALTMVTLALDYSIEQGELKDERISYFKKRSKKDKRRRIALGVITHSATLGIGFGLGRI